MQSVQRKDGPGAPSSGLGAWLGAPHPRRCDESSSAEETTAVGVQNSGGPAQGRAAAGNNQGGRGPLPIPPYLPPGAPGPPRWGPS